ncbi:LysM peptidoglycan-binding domain-containing protein [Cellulophaga baltica]|uniref:LysM peptidoglycan-binding domain-containing protein n=1 Tax=Cellulophaga TaxID=104264 RepID=UPI001C06DBE8|nr:MULTISPECIES: LysM peptidoglycan-binding domain-containing protein [Cellulophaga]MBU2996586.1 LysM peptidoglycan-binding domain-containing protein [Cellulophaga baltica]MDO6767980.1 LysM peptidoglycan-binding domain-containing protein [Cellulophaga sp. 1_MG-2023]
MKKPIFKNYLTIVFVMLFSVTAFAQKFTTHSVKKGETLEGISQQYKVTPESIVALNREIKGLSELKSSTILVIPLDAKASEVKDVVVTKSKSSSENVIVVQEEPTGFETYKVKKKDNLYRLSEKFNVSQDAIKRYNKELYSVQLKKGMYIKIPKYKKIIAEENPFDSGDFENYTVKPKETRWSIVSKYGITMDSLLVLNPDLSHENTYVAAGQVLLLPKLAGSSTENQTTQLYTSYVVPAKKGFYSLEKEFGATEAEIKALNPEVKERGLQEGMEIRIPKKKADPTAVNTDNFIFYEVKKGETEYSLTRKLGVKYKELLALNPDLESGFKTGMVLKLPKNSEGDFEVKNSLVIENVNLINSMNLSTKPNLVLMLPFRLDLIDVNQKEAAVNSINKRKDANYSLGLYSGALVAIDSINKLGLSVNVSVLDNEKSVSKTKQLLMNSAVKNADVIIGPLDAASLQEVAVRVGAKQIPVVAPLPAKTDVSLSNVFYSIPSDEVLRNHIFSFIKENRTTQNIVVINDAAHATVKNLIVQEFPDAKSLLLDEKFAMKNKILALLSSKEENWVFLESDMQNTVNSVVSVLNASINDRIKIRLFTTNKGKTFDGDKINHTHLSNLSFTYPSIEGDEKYDSFEKAYKRKFSGKTPDKFARRGFDLTFDVLLKLAFKQDLFEASKFVGETTYSANKFDYQNKGASGFYNNSSYIMAYDNMWIKEIKD